MIESIHHDQTKLQSRILSQGEILSQSKVQVGDARAVWGRYRGSPTAYLPNACVSLSLGDSFVARLFRGRLWFAKTPAMLMVLTLRVMGRDTSQP
jgi:hypothetical protein